MEPKNSKKDWSVVIRRYVRKALISGYHSSARSVFVSGDSKTAHHSPAWNSVRSLGKDYPCGTGCDTHKRPKLRSEFSGRSVVENLAEERYPSRARVSVGAAALRSGDSWVKQMGSQNHNPTPTRAENR